VLWNGWDLVIIVRVMPPCLGGKRVTTTMILSPAMQVLRECLPSICRPEKPNGKLGVCDVQHLPKIASAANLPPA
jgi:hypothetical protein